MTILLQLTRVSRSFAAVKAVDEVSLHVNQGEFLTLLGPSGCGKTTTLRLIAGFEVPDAGTIHFKDTLLADGDKFVPPKDRHIGMVFQDYALFPHLNVAQNIGFGLRGDKHQNQNRVNAMLELVDLKAVEQRKPFELSGGQQQRVALARALAPAPEVLLLDEPFSNLDAALRMQLRGEMRAILRQTGTTCIFVTHAQDEALSLSDRIAVLFNGKIAQVDTPEVLYQAPARLDVATFVGEANLIQGQAHGDYADSILGKIPLAQSKSGNVMLMIRPEMLELSSPSESDNPEITATIQWSEYYGHDRRLGLTLSDGTALIARVHTAHHFSPHQKVAVRVQGQVMAY